MKLSTENNLIFNPIITRCYCKLPVRYFTQNTSENKLKKKEIIKNCRNLYNVIVRKHSYLTSFPTYSKHLFDCRSRVKNFPFTSYISSRNYVLSCKDIKKEDDSKKKEAEDDGLLTCKNIKKKQEKEKEKEERDKEIKAKLCKRCFPKDNLSVYRTPFWERWWKSWFRSGSAKIKSAAKKSKCSCVVPGTEEDKEKLREFIEKKIEYPKPCLGPSKRYFERKCEEDKHKEKECEKRPEPEEECAKEKRKPKEECAKEKPKPKEECAKEKLKPKEECAKEKLKPKEECAKEKPKPKKDCAKEKPKPKEECAKETEEEEEEDEDEEEEFYEEDVCEEKDDTKKIQDCKNTFVQSLSEEPKIESRAKWAATKPTKADACKEKTSKDKKGNEGMIENISKKTSDFCKTLIDLCKTKQGRKCQVCKPLKGVKMKTSKDSKKTAKTLAKLTCPVSKKKRKKKKKRRKICDAGKKKKKQKEHLCKKACNALEPTKIKPDDLKLPERYTCGAGLLEARIKARRKYTDEPAKYTYKDACKKVDAKKDGKKEKNKRKKVQCK